MSSIIDTRFISTAELRANHSNDEGLTFETSLQSGYELENTRFHLPVREKWCHPSPTAIFH